MEPVRSRNRGLRRGRTPEIWLATALIGLIGAPVLHAQTAEAPQAQNFANGNPAAAQKAAENAIPLTPAMIEELGRRFNAIERAKE